MDVIIFGITGFRELIIPLEQLEVEELEVGSEFIYRNSIYEIRSLTEIDRGLLMNVVLTQA